MNILEMSTAGGILILGIILLRCLTIDLLKKRTFVILWQIVLLRLLLTITIPMKFSIANLIASLSGNKEVLYASRDILNSSAAGGVKSTEPLTTGVIHPELPIITIVWLVGAVLFFGIFLFLYRKEYKRMQEALPINNSDFINHWLANKPIKRDIKVMTADFITTPVTYGIIIPRIILPKIMDLSNTKQLECVMTHELVHIKRFDNMLKIVSIIALCIHWFNPLTWVMYFLLNRDLELSCDEKVLSMLGENEKQFYAYTLIGLAEQKARMNLIYNGFGKNAIKERITTIMKYKKMTAMGMALSVIAVLASTNVFAAAEKDRDTSSTNSNANSTAVYYTTKAGPSSAVESELAGEIAKSEPVL
jgi:beta-lactamase regulating signal transducer with metallopeptidase domain